MADRLPGDHVARFVHPLRVGHLRVLNIGLLVVWAALALYAIVKDLSPEPYALWALSLIAVYFLIAGLLRRPA